jgi:uncharacterized membrane protein
MEKLAWLIKPWLLLLVALIVQLILQWLNRHH